MRYILQLCTIRYKDGLEMHDSERVQTQVSKKGHAQLVIMNATYRDTGLYRCEAHNFAGRSQVMANVRVRGRRHFCAHFV